MPAVEFTSKIKDVKTSECEDAVFQCVLSTPLNRITWSKQDSSLDDEDKYEITVSEDKLTHTLRVKDCEVADNGAYYAIAGITSSKASLTVKGGIFTPFTLLVAYLKSVSTKNIIYSHYLYVLTVIQLIQMLVNVVRPPKLKRIWLKSRPSFKKRKTTWRRTEKDRLKKALQMQQLKLL